MAPNPPPAVPAPSASQPRTVGGHTARLLVPEDDDLPLDPLGSSSLPMPLDDSVNDGTSGSLRPRGFVSSPPPSPRSPGRRKGSSPPAPSGHDRREGPKAHGLGPLPETNDPPSSRTVGGTARLATVSPEEAAAAEREALRQAAQKAAGKSPATTGPLPAPTRGTRDAVSASTAGSRAGAVSSTLALLLAPSSVTVGLVFFAMGSMLTLAVEGRSIRLTLPAPIVVTPVVPVVSALAPPPGPPPAALGVVSVSTPVPVTATSVIPPPAVVPPPAVTQVKVSVPPAPPAPPVAPHPQGGSKRPPLGAAPQ